MMKSQIADYYLLNARFDMIANPGGDFHVKKLGLWWENVS